ncbi:MAG: helix-turn-helix transcriptional regulator [Chloroflexi bacterium]|nr:helix-turn-helix transcriptional regulator [Chloroflexota bacterium]
MMAAADSYGRQRRAAERREETRERLLAAALEVFAEQGYHAGTTKAITQRAGVAEGLLFHYFPTKAELLVAVAERAPLGVEMRRLLAEAAGRPVAEALPDIARRWFQVLRDNRALLRVFFEQAHADPRVHAVLQAHGERFAALIADYLAERAALGELRPIDHRVAARMLFHSIFGLAMLCEQLPAELTDAEERLLEQQVDLLLYGMLTPAGRVGAPRAEGQEER